MERVYTIPEAALYLGYSEGYIRDVLIRRGHLSPVIQRTARGPIRIPHSTLQGFIIRATRTHHLHQSVPPAIVPVRRAGARSVSSTRVGRVAAAAGGSPAISDTPETAGR